MKCLTACRPRPPRAAPRTPSAPSKGPSAARVLPKRHVRLARRSGSDLARPVVEEVGVRVGDREGRTRVTKHEVELVGPRQCRKRDGDRADLRGAKKRGDEPG